jgi:hypothetical protein
MPIIMLQLTRDIRGALEAGGAAGRQTLRELLAGPITVTPELDGEGRLVEWTYLGEAILDRVLAGRLSPGQTPTVPKTLDGMFHWLLAQHPVGPHVRDEEGASGYVDEPNEAINSLRRP